jgi:pimeloyl-ACP methyl ester carboxylesterase
MDVLDTHYAVTPDGVYIAYQTMGSGPIDLVWQTDWPGNIDIEQEGLLYSLWFEELASFSRLIFHDRRGIGLSSRNVPLPDLDTRVSDLLMVLDAVGSEHPVLAGISESGAPNALLAATRPERVQSVVWLEPTPKGASAPDYPWGRRPEELEGNVREIELWGTLAYGKAYVQGAASRGHVIPDYVATRMAKASRNACTPDVARNLEKIWDETDVRGVLPAIGGPYAHLGVAR